MSEPTFIEGRGRGGKGIDSTPSDVLLANTTLISGYNLKLVVEMNRLFPVAQSGSPDANSTFVDYGETVVTNLEEYRRINQNLMGRNDQGARERTVEDSFHMVKATGYLVELLDLYSDVCGQYIGQYSLSDRLLKLKGRVDKLRE